MVMMMMKSLKGEKEYIVLYQFIYGCCTSRSSITCIIIAKPIMLRLGWGGAKSEKVIRVIELKSMRIVQYFVLCNNGEDLCYQSFEIKDRIRENEFWKV